MAQASDLAMEGRPMPTGPGGRRQAMANKFRGRRLSATPGAMGPKPMPVGASPTGPRPMAPTLGTDPAKPMPTGPTLGATAMPGAASFTAPAPVPFGASPTGARPMATGPNLGPTAAPAQGGLQSLVDAGQGGMTQNTLNAQRQGVTPGMTLQQMIEMQKRGTANRGW